MKYLPLDLSTFSTMMTNNYIYVDKTKYIYDLFSGGSRLYFLSRPRRFGKSLLISTLKELFLGNRELFKGLWIDSSDYEWKSYPVIHLDFATISHKNPQDIELELSQRLQTIAHGYDISTLPSVSASGKLYELVQQLGQKNKVVILIDEYDKPILDHIADMPLAYAMKDAMRGIYDTIKGLDEHLRAVFVTGVTKFAKTSVFSGMNNLNDISFSPVSAALLGYTQEELEHYFGDYIQNIVDQEETSCDAVLAIMKEWYNGYRFSKLPIKVYNPFSVMYYLSKQELANYWFKSGTPTFLIHLIQKQYSALEEIPTAALKSDTLDTFELNNIPLIPLLFQAGYLTIDDYNIKNNKITLRYPNHEVEESFTKHIITSLTDATTSNVDTAVDRILKALEIKNLDSFCTALQSLFARIPYSLHIEQESYYHSLFQFLMNLLIIETQSEVLTNIGRIDSVIQNDNYIYVFELKLNKTPEEAMQQILDRKYYQSYTIYNKPIILVGLIFKTGNERLAVSYISQDLNQI